MTTPTPAASPALVATQATAGRVSAPRLAPISTSIQPARGPAAALAAVLLSAFVAACGGGGSGSAAGSTPAADAPAPGSLTGASADTPAVGNAPAATYTLSGTLSGLANGAQLVLRNAGGAPLTVSATGRFVFPGSLAAGDSYSVQVDAQPSGQTCTVARGTGTGVQADVADVDVVCATNSYVIGGSVSGLAGGSLVLSDNGSDPLTLSADGAFTFATPVAHGGSYQVTITNQPVGRTCSLAGASGSSITGAVTSVAVSCAVNSYTVGGTVADLPAGTEVVLRNGGGAPLTLSADGSFTFPAAVAHGGSYAVTLDTQPMGAMCDVSAGSGTVSAAVSGVAVRCRPVTIYVGASLADGGRVNSFGIQASGALTAPGWSWLSPGGGGELIAAGRPGTVIYAAGEGAASGHGYTLWADGTAHAAVVSRVAGLAAMTGLAYERSARYVYAIDNAFPAVTGYDSDPANGINHQVAQLTLPTTPTTITVDPRSARMWVTDDSGAFYRIDLAADGSATLGASVALPAPSHPATNVAPHPTLPLVFVPVPADGKVYVYGTAGSGTPTLVGEAAYAGPGPGYSAVDPSGRYLYVLVGNTISVSGIGVDGALTSLSSAPTVTGAAKLVVDPGGRALIVASTTTLRTHVIQAGGALVSAGDTSVNIVPKSLTVSP